jgi:hypothetical protein
MGSNRSVRLVDKSGIPWLNKTLTTCPPLVLLHVPACRHDVQGSPTWPPKHGGNRRSGQRWGAPSSLVRTMHRQGVDSCLAVTHLMLAWAGRAYLHYQALSDLLG